MTFSFRRGIHSISARLVLLFIIMAILFIVALSASLRSSFRGNFEDNIQPHLVRYLEYIRDDIGIPPDIEKARILIRDLPVEIYIAGPDSNWSSDDPIPGLDAIHYFRNLNANGVRYSWGHNDGRDYLVSHSNDYTMVFSLQYARKRTWNRFMPIFATLLILVPLYHATKRLIAPIHTIRTGIEKIGTGEQDYRLNINCRDELGQLAHNINAGPMIFRICWRQNVNYYSPSCIKQNTNIIYYYLAAECPIRNNP